MKRRNAQRIPSDLVPVESFQVPEIENQAVALGNRTGINRGWFQQIEELIGALPGGIHPLDERAMQQRCSSRHRSSRYGTYRLAPKRKARKLVEKLGVLEGADRKKSGMGGLPTPLQV